MWEILLQLNGASVLCIFSLQPIRLQCVINICLLCVISRYTYWSLFAVIILWSTTKTLFFNVSLLIITKLYLSQRIESISLYYFVTQLFAAVKYIFDNLKESISDTNQAFKDRDISGFVQSFWGISWFWIKSYGFSDS